MDLVTKPDGRDKLVSLAKQLQRAAPQSNAAAAHMLTATGVPRWSIQTDERPPRLLSFGQDQVVTIGAVSIISHDTIEYGLLTNTELTQITCNRVATMISCFLVEANFPNIRLVVCM